MRPRCCARIRDRCLHPSGVERPSVAARSSLVLGAFLVSTPLHAADDYTLGPDSQPQAGVPKGKVTSPHRVQEQGLPDTVRQYWVYVPAQYDGQTPACVMVFQDGAQLRRTPSGEFRVPVVFDNLIHKKEMPVTIGIFINPGVIGRRAAGRAVAPRQPQLRVRHAQRRSTPASCSRRSCRRSARSTTCTSDPDGRAICGISSRRHLRVHRRLGAARRVPQGAQPRRQLHQHPRRRRLPGLIRKTRAASRSASSCRTAATTSTTSTATGRSANQEMAAALKFTRLRLQVRLRRRRPQRQARRRDPARLAALAVARLSEVRAPQRMRSAHRRSLPEVHVMRSAAALLLFAATAAYAQAPLPNPAPPPDPEGIAQHDLNRTPPSVVKPVEGVPPAAPGKPPSDAVVLFDGKDLSKWKSQGKDARRGVEGRERLLRGREGHGRHRDEAELRRRAAPHRVDGADAGRRREPGPRQQRRLLQGRYEVQVLDSYQSETYPDGQAGALYGQFPPLVNATRPPGEWQAYDIVFQMPRFDGEGHAREARPRHRRSSTACWCRTRRS